MIQTFAANDFPVDATGAWQEDSQEPALFALYLAHPKKSDDYLNFLVSEGRLTDFAKAKNRLFFQAYNVSFAKFDRMLNEGILDYDNWEEKKGFYEILAINGDPAFDKWFKQRFARIDFDNFMQEEVLSAWLYYHFSSGKAETAIDEILSWQKSNGNSNVWMLGERVVKVAMLYSDQATKNATRTYIRTALERTEVEELNFEMARMLLGASYIIQ